MTWGTLPLDEITRRAHAFNDAAARANNSHALAMQDFHVAVMRYEWERAGAKHQEALMHFDAYLTAIYNQYKFSQQLVQQVKREEDDGA